MRSLEPRELEIGMVTAEPVCTPVGQLLAPAGTVITKQLINRMKLYRVESVKVQGDDPKTATEVSPSKPEETPVEPVQIRQPKTRGREQNAFTKSSSLAGIQGFSICIFCMHPEDERFLYSSCRSQ